jgi:hypothetical protein
LAARAELLIQRRQEIVQIDVEHSGDGLHGAYRAVAFPVFDLRQLGVGDVGGGGEFADFHAAMFAPDPDMVFTRQDSLGHFQRYQLVLSGGNSGEHPVRFAYVLRILAGPQESLVIGKRQDNEFLSGGTLDDLWFAHFSLL